MTTTLYPNWRTLAAPRASLNQAIDDRDTKRALAALAVLTAQVEQIDKAEKEEEKLGRASAVADGVMVAPSLMRRGEKYGGIDV